MGNGLNDPSNTRHDIESTTTSSTSFSSTSTPSTRFTVALSSVGQDGGGLSNLPSSGGYPTQQLRKRATAEVVQSLPRRFKPAWDDTVADVDIDRAVAMHFQQLQRALDDPTSDSFAETPTLSQPTRGYTQTSLIGVAMAYDPHR